jgi:hypothetical protein
MSGVNTPATGIGMSENAGAPLNTTTVDPPTLGALELPLNPHAPALPLHSFDRICVQDCFTTPVLSTAWCAPFPQHSPTRNSEMDY